MKHISTFFLILAGSFALSAQTFQFYENGKRPAPPQPQQQGETGFGVYYADYLHGEPTSMGETYDMNRLSCAHNTHPLGTLLKVTRIDNGSSVTVRVNDRGPRTEGCVVLLSKAAAIQLDLLKLGKTRVRVEVVGYSETTPSPPAMASRYEAAPNSYSADLTAKGVSPTYTQRQIQPNNTYSYNAQPEQRPTEYQTSSYAAQQRQTVQQQQPVLTAKSVQGNTRVAAGSQQYIIQFGCYRDYDNALRHADSMRKQGAADAIVREMSSPNGVLYKVTSANYSSKESAQLQLDVLRNYNISDGIVVMLR